LVCVSLASAQTGATPPTGVNPVKVAGTEWKGSETLDDFGELTFQFSQGDEVLMIDAQSDVAGHYVQNGATVTITFGNCVYVGTINGNVMSGTAHFTDGDDTSWSFSVNLQPK
ncbi:MAG TPA: hypothetical protein VE988_12375, partial [Gemmataceae bacterium]|nr:hypothetical protein [Gemmataceae bacterium]